MNTQDSNTPDASVTETENKKTQPNITLKKGLRKGTYTVRIRVAAAGDDTYSAGSSCLRSL